MSARAQVSKVIVALTLIILDDIDTSQTGHGLNSDGASVIVSMTFPSLTVVHQLTREHDV